MAGLGELQIGRITRFFQKWSGMKGKAFPVSIGSEISPSLRIFSGVEDRAFHSWSRYMGRLSATGGAGQTAGVRFRNPVGSGMVAVLEKITIGGTTADQAIWTIGAQNADLTTTLVQNGRLDPRSPAGPAGTSMLITSTSTNATITAASQFGVFFFGANSQVDIITDEDQEITILPGDAVTIVDNVVALAFNVSTIWRERALEDSEKF
jgi:hypothetical protein